MTGVLGWTPNDFNRSRVGEVYTALSGFNQYHEQQMQFQYNLQRQQTIALGSIQLSENDRERFMDAIPSWEEMQTPPVVEDNFQSKEVQEAIANAIKDINHG
ncbi:hypothetical protein K4L44_05825 [Halosquirtibacter laminarini]|uniref:Uncharacterized protein n=1 Tax=Halosquirtibacter laminarini TaxID=3374600 RepID=A0AC61NPF0_9BACT|nr:hypothetical protein K4L44_05825 [Prolixibacteraceae bacterium]